MMKLLDSEKDGKNGGEKGADELSTYSVRIQYVFSTYSVRIQYVFSTHSLRIHNEGGR
ncbi:MAG: hypothetical protein AB9882_13560 [Ignavibacteriaceae bacterium]